MKTALIVLVVLLILAAAGGGAWWLSQNTGEAGPSPLEATGIIEARQVTIAPEIGGKVVEVLVEEGEPVTAGQPLVQLDDALLLVQRSQAEAALRAAQASLALLEAGPTEAQLQAAEAQLAQTQANLRLAQAALDAATPGARPEDVAAMREHLTLSRAGYDGLTVVFTSDQVEKVRFAVTGAESNLSAATARRDDLAADTRNPTFTLAAAQAAVADAEAALELAQQAYDAARPAADTPQPYYVQIELARLSWEMAQANVTQAQARLEGLQTDARTTPDALDAAEATLADTQAQVAAAQAAHEALASGISAPRLAAAWAEVQRAQAHLAALTVVTTGVVTTGVSDAAPAVAPISVEALLAQVDGALALRDAAAANLTALSDGARAEQVQAAQAQVDAAQAQLDALDLQLVKLTLTAPWDGVVLLRSVEPGQLVLPGSALLEIGRLAALELVAYLPEQQFGQVMLGQAVMAHADAYPGRHFSGTVLRLADEAEFTPTNVQTKEDRARLVYALVIGLDNPDLALKPGMIADVTFEP